MYRVLAPVAVAVVVSAAYSATVGIVAYCWCRGAWAHVKEAVMA
jgi:hypothetical protein